MPRLTRPLFIDPTATLTFSMDWSDWLAPGDTIASRLWSLTPAAELFGASEEQVVIRKCKAGIVYRLSCRVTTRLGYREERTMVLRCENK
jgi:hypothetical protein